MNSFPYKSMSCLWSLIWSKHLWRSWYLIIWLEINVQSSGMDSGQLLFQIDSRTWLFRTLFLDTCFKNPSDSGILWKYQPLSNQSFKHKSANILSLNLSPKLYFELSFCIFIFNGYYTKSKHLQSLDSLFYLGISSLLL